jgi:hypothetical protein
MYKNKSTEPKLIVKESITIKPVFKNKYISLYIIGLIILFIVSVFLISIYEFYIDFRPIACIFIIVFIFYFIYFRLLISKVIKNKIFHLLHLIVSILVLLVTLLIIVFGTNFLTSDWSLMLSSTFIFVFIILIVFFLFLIAPFILFIIYDSINLSKKH